MFLILTKQLEEISTLILLNLYMVSLVLFNCFITCYLLIGLLIEGSTITESKITSF